VTPRSPRQFSEGYRGEAQVDTAPLTTTSLQASAAPLSQLWVPAPGAVLTTIEDDAAAHLKADFANCCLGGGVLGTGCVQEEIMFVLYPELLVGAKPTSRAEWPVAVYKCVHY
jgi:hypothetical protein